MSTPTNQSSQSSHGLDVEGLRASTVYTQDGDKIGKVGEVYLDDASGEPEWVTVKTGMFGSSESFVPLARATSADGDLRVPYTKDQVKDAPRTDADGAVTPEEEQRLYDHYGIAYTEAGSGSDEQGRQTTGQTAQTGRDDLSEGAAAGAAGGAAMGAAGTTGRTGTSGDDATTGREGDARRDRTGEAGIQGRDTSGPTTDDAMTRSEERLQVGTERREAGRARLRKHIVTERQTQQVGVSHDELKVEREPITDANRGAATSGAELSEEEHEVVLHEERPVVSKTVEAVERVRLGTETVHDTENVSADVRKEQIDLDQDAERAESATARGDEGTARR